MKFAKFVLMGGLITVVASAASGPAFEEPCSVGSSGAVREKVLTPEELKAKLKSRKEQAAQRGKVLSRKLSQNNVKVAQGNYELATELSKNASASYQKLLEKHRKEDEEFSERQGIEGEEADNNLRLATEASEKATADYEELLERHRKEREAEAKK